MALSRFFSPWALPPPPLAPPAKPRPFHTFVVRLIPTEWITVEAAEVTVHSTGALLFLNHHAWTLRAFAPGTWASARLKPKEA